MEEILHQAEQLEKDYDWFGAAGLYEKAASLLPQDDFSKMGEVHERLGHAFHRVAFQAETNEEFRQRLNQAVRGYGKARELYQKLDEPMKTGKILRCDAMIAYMGYWLASEVSEKKRLIYECWKLAKGCLKNLEELKDFFQYGRTFNQLSTCIDLGFFLEQDFLAREKTMKEAVECGERAVKFLSADGDVCELARAYAKTATFLHIYGAWFFPIDEREEKLRKALNYWSKGSEFSEETAMLELPSVLFGTGPGGYWGDGTDAAVSNLEKALKYSRKTRDRFIIGRALDSLAYHSFWSTGGIEDPDRRVERAKVALEYAEQARNMYGPISFTSPRGGLLWTGAPYPVYYWAFAQYETNLGKRRELLEKALEAAPEELKRAQDSGYVDILAASHLFFGLILRDLASTEEDSTEKKKLLEEALVHDNESARLTEQVAPLNAWDRYIGRGFVGSVRGHLAELEKDVETKKSMLQEVLLASEESLRLLIEGEFPSILSEGSPIFGRLGVWRYEDGGISQRLYELTKDRIYLTKATEAFEDAGKWFQRVNLVSRMAECYWKAAQTYDTFGDHLKAAQDFHLASNNYRSAAEKIPQLKSFYNDHALYMQAWTEIEKGRHHHERQEYGLAKEHFEKAADLHKSLKQWGYLASNYSAWANVEQAEDLSRKERCEEAVQAFEQAVKLFDETKKSLKDKLNKIEDSDEKQMATSMVNATDTRYEYCISRIALEEARILDKKGDHYASSEKYGSASETFEKLSQRLESEQEQREFKFITCLSRAWQKMTRAEAEASPALYFEASQLFEEAKEFGSSERIKMLTLGHSRFCRALEAGTRFIDTRDRTLHDAVIQHLGSAADYYVKAGFQNASEYARATKLLFDAYVHIGNAETETDPEKKAKFYTMAEKILQTSAGSFMKAEHPEKREQVLRLQDKVKEERELAISLYEVLHAPTIVSATTSFSTPNPTHESAVGLERFEHADIQANMMTRQKEMKVGECFNLEIELVNAGRGPALLTKITEIIPEGFELTEKPEMYRTEDGCLNMRGKRLDPLKMEEVRLVLKPKVQGVFPLKPKILYLDENGKHKLHEPEPITITVKELGIKGWIKGDA